MDDQSARIEESCEFLLRLLEPGARLFLVDRLRNVVFCISILHTRTHMFYMQTLNLKP